MNKRIRLAVAAAAVVGGFTVSQAGAVSAAHCVPRDDPATAVDESKSTPGFSYFGQDGREDGEPRGASVCRERTGSPSQRAPGQQGR